MSDDDKSIEIRVTAVLKSVIESGAPSDEWEILVRKGVAILCKVASDHKEKLKAFRAKQG